MMRNHTTIARWAAVPLAALVLAASAGCGGSAKPAGSSTAAARSMSMSTSSDTTQARTQSPVQTGDADWKTVSDSLGRTGTLTGGTVYKVPLPRKDLTVVTQGVTVKPGLSLGGYAAFAKYGDGTMLMGDLVVTEAELPKVTDALQKAGIEQTALHKHLLSQTPAIWWTHIHAMGDPATLATRLKTVLAATGIPAASPPPATQPAVDLDTAGIDAALGRKGAADGGIYKFTIARNDTVSDGGHVIPAAMGVTTGINFQPVGGGKAAINGDFAMTGPEVQKVVQALRAGGIDIVEVHNHSLTDNPRLFYAHFWAVDDAVGLAKTLRTALDATDVKPAS